MLIARKFTSFLNILNKLTKKPQKNDPFRKYIYMKGVNL